MSKPVKVSAAALFVVAGIPLAIVVAGGQRAAAATKSVTCPDNTSGVSYAGWKVVCTGQSAIKATITLSKDASGYLELGVQAPSTTSFVSASSSFDEKKVTCTLVLQSRSIGSRPSITVTATPLNGASPQGVTVIEGARLSNGRRTRMRLQPAF